LRFAASIALHHSGMNSMPLRSKGWRISTRVCSSVRQPTATQGFDGVNS